jgi:hypothetical protein
VKTWRVRRRDKLVGCSVVLLVLLAACGDEARQLSAGAAGQGAVSSIHVVRIDAPDGLTGILPTVGTSHFVGDIDHWTAETAIGAFGYDRERDTAVGVLDGGPDDAATAVTVRPVETGDIRPDQMLASVIEVPAAVWEETVANPEEVITLVARSFDLGSLGTVKQTISGSLRSGYSVLWRATGVQYGHSPCVACAGQVHQGPAFSAGGRHYISVVLPPGSIDPAVDQAIAGWMVEDPITRGPIIFAELPAGERNIDVSFIDDDGIAQKSELTYVDE